MTDEQANNITREQAIRILHPDTSIEAIDDYEEAGNYEHAYDTACLMAVDALRGLDPDTGDVGKRVQGCWYCNDDVMQVADSPNKPPINATYCGLCGRKLEVEG